MKVLVFGVTGMLGSAVFRFFSNDADFSVYGTIRNDDARSYFSSERAHQLRTCCDANNQDALIEIFSSLQPDIVINCIGLVKQLKSANDPLQIIPINTLLPHRLASLCKATHARLIHISTDCVFSGAKGHYVESDFPDADDLYGRSKLLGEVVDYPHAITLRTSIIGHELGAPKALIDWFLSQEKSVKGFTKAIFSGLTTLELARVIHRFVIPKPELHGLYHVAANAISKFDLLTLVKKIYDKPIDIIPSDELTLDRSLNGERFCRATGYQTPDWDQLINNLYEFQ